jgi:hypothetical protein
MYILRKWLNACGRQFSSSGHSCQGNPVDVDASILSGSPGCIRVVLQSGIGIDQMRAEDALRIPEASIFLIDLHIHEEWHDGEALTIDTGSMTHRGLGLTR